MSTIYSNNDSIKINFPDDKFQKYLSLIRIEDKDLNPVNIELIFALSFMDFKNGVNSLDEFSEIANYLLSVLDVKTKTTTTLGTVIESAAELNFYIRNIKDINDNSVAGFMTQVEDYFKKVKPNLLDQAKNIN